MVGELDIHILEELAARVGEADLASPRQWSKTTPRSPTRYLDWGQAQRCKYWNIITRGSFSLRTFFFSFPFFFLPLFFSFLIAALWGIPIGEEQMSRETKKKKGTEKEQFLLLDGHDVVDMTVDFG